MDENGGYNDSNRAFLQAVLSHSFMTFEVARPILAAIFSVNKNEQVSADSVTQDDFNSYISDANTALSPLDLEIRSTFHQVTRGRIYALVNTTSDPLTQLATSYTADEIAYVKRLLNAMFDGPHNRGRTEAMCLSSMEAIQLARSSNRRDTQNGNTQSGGMTLREAQDMLQRLTDEGWLEQSEARFYSLSPRALMELKGWLVDAFNGTTEEDEEGEDSVTINDKIKFCHACKDIITVGQRCPNYECPCRLHNNCTQSFFRVQRSQTCPVCNTEWDAKNYVGEKAITTSDAYLKGRRRSGHRSQVETNGDSNSVDAT